MSPSTTIRTEIIPDRVRIVRTAAAPELDWKAICVFAATGFFLEADTYYRHERALQPATDYELDGDGRVQQAHPYWRWHYTPRDISLGQATDEFAHLFERITREQTAGRRVILPLSGGLDSRTQAAAVRGLPAVQTYSYRFTDSFDETKYGKLIAAKQGYPFKSFVIPAGYLWSVIDQLAALNRCQSDFTHPRQMAVIDEVANLGDLFFLGHWGDVLFDGMGVPSAMPFDDQVTAVTKKIVRKGGIELAATLWQAWGLDGEFEPYLRDRIGALLAAIQIDDANARIRAFKSMYWAPRWTSVNLCTFSSRRAIALPYYHADMCELVCRVPERHLAGRQIQIEYMKRCSPALACIPWQSYDPLDLYNYRDYYSYRMLPYRGIQRAKRVLREKLLRKQIVSRNWEIQFVGKNNDAHLREHLFARAALAELVPPSVVKRFYELFATGDSARYAHPVSMLLTLSLFAQQQRRARDN